jgi:hypothetical protein
MGSRPCVDDDEWDEAAKRNRQKIRRAALILALILGTLIFAAIKARAADRACTPADIARFEWMVGGGMQPIKPGQYRTDPRFQVTVHYLGTSIGKDGVCNIRLRPAG